MSCQLVIDRGNTRTKLGVFKGSRLVKVLVMNHFGVSEIQKIFKAYQPESSILCSVAEVPKSVMAFLRRQPGFIELTAKTPLPIRIRYKTPKTLGADRRAAAVASFATFPGKPVLVIDVGTCIKFDFLDDKGTYHGGAISPGLTMRMKAMHQFTGRLPLFPATAPMDFIGKDTRSSMSVGAVIGACHEAAGFVAQYRKKYPGLKVVLTGGDAKLLSKRLKFGIFAAPDWVLTGLHEILLYASKKESY